MIRRALLPIALVALLAGCSAEPGAGSPYPLPDGAAALRWGAGPYGLVLVPDSGRDAVSWDALARVLAEEGMTVVAVGQAEPAVVEAAIRQLQAGGVERVAVLAAGAGSNAAFALGVEQPALVDQLIVLSARGNVSRLGVFPKLFVASEGEGAAGEAERMTDEAPGDWNALFLAPGDDSGQAILEGEGAEAAREAIVQRLEERR
jgi:hypothetical protein